MRPTRLRLQGFTSFKEPAEVDFSGLDRFVISGPTGAGKSSLLDAMTFALYADAPRVGAGALTDMISLGQNSFRVTLDFRIGTQDYRVTRVRQRAGGVTGDQIERLANGTPIHEKSGTNEVSKRIRELVGLNIDQFTQAVFLPQGKFAEFLKSKARERRDLLTDLLRLGVYERMRAHAFEKQKDASTRRDMLDQRLNGSEFASVTIATKQTLELQVAQLEHSLQDALGRLPNLQARHDTARQTLEWTRELEGKLSSRDRFGEQEEPMNRDRDRLAAARRSERVIPLLDQADRARKAFQERDDKLAAADKQVEQLGAAHSRARQELAAVNTRAADLPELRTRLQSVLQAVGRVGQRNDLSNRLKLLQQIKRRIERQLPERFAGKGEIANAISDLETELNAARTHLAAVAFAPEQLQRLESIQADALELQGRRAQAADDERSEAKYQSEAAAAELSARKAVDDELAACQLRDQAEAALQAAERLLRQAEDDHKAAHLRHELKPGEACPVCLQTVKKVPAAKRAPVLEMLKKQSADAGHALNKARQKAEKAVQAAAAAGANSDTNRKQVQAAEKELKRLRASIKSSEAKLRNLVGELPGPDVDLQVEQRVILALEACRKQEREHRRALDNVNELDNKLALKRQDDSVAARDLVQLQCEQKENSTAIGELLVQLDRVENAIRDAAGSDDPAAVQVELQKNIDALDMALKQAVEAESAAANQLTVVQSTRENCVHELNDAKQTRDDVDRRAVAALAEAEFANSTAARSAFLSSANQADLDQRIRSFDAELAALDARLNELNDLLGGRRITSEEYESVRNELEDCNKTKADADKQLSILNDRLRTLRGKLEEADQLRKEKQELEKQYRVYKQLADDLKSDGFQAYLLTETLQGLIRDATVHLSRLTGNRYGLDFKDDRILIVDYDNAGETRVPETLSGGETFLASLALALALSDQVQRTAGAVRLDCLFIDEGFGTLDPETLRVVADAIHNLQAGGRMVGIITHVDELKEEFSDKIMVSKQGGSSRVEVTSVS